MSSESIYIQHQLASWLLRKTPKNGIRRVIPISAAVATDIGGVRNENQDKAMVCRGRDKSGEEYVILIVADGIGGMSDGAACAALAISSFVASYHKSTHIGSGGPLEWILKAANFANESVFEKFRGNGGSTLIALVIRANKNAYWLSIGDSRVYGFSGKTLTQLSSDDTIAGQLGKRYEIAYEQSKLLQYVGMGADIVPHVNTIDINSFESLLLTTDGVHYLDSQHGLMSQIIANASDAGACTKRLVDVSSWCGGLDNASIAMITVSQEWEVNKEHLFPCIEVWDSFSELQITLLIKNEPEPQVVSPTGFPSSVISSGVIAESAPLSRPKNSPTKQRSTKNSKKTKRGTKELHIDPNKDVLNLDKPQLHMEFPNKQKE